MHRRQGIDHVRYLLRLAELEMIDREQRLVERHIRAARFPSVKSLDSYDFTALPSLNKVLVLELAQCEYLARRENVIALGNAGTGEEPTSRWASVLPPARRDLRSALPPAAAFVHELI